MATIGRPASSSVRPSESFPVNGQTTTQSPAAAWLAENTAALTELVTHFSSDALRHRLEVLARRPRYTGPARQGGAYLAESGELVIHGLWTPEQWVLLKAWADKVLGMEEAP